MTEQDVPTILAIFKFLWEATPYIIGFLVAIYIGAPSIWALFFSEEKSKNGE